MFVEPRYQTRLPRSRQVVISSDKLMRKFSNAQDENKICVTYIDPIHFHERRVIFTADDGCFVRGWSEIDSRYKSRWASLLE